ncbi:MAG: reverse transcriptase domain-containing protein [Nodosilinea sp.]
MLADFLATDPYPVYVPKRLRFRYRLAAYLAYLRSWLKLRYTFLTTAYRQWTLYRNLLRTNYRYRAQSAWDLSPSELPCSFMAKCSCNQHALSAKAALLAYDATDTHPKPQQFIMDTDSKPLGVDNRATAYISGDITDFDGPMTDTNRVIRGFGGTRIGGVKRGTAVVRIEDDTGLAHRFRLRNSYYVPGTKDRLFSPQHFAQEMQRQRKGKVLETTNDTHCILTWGNGRYTRTIPLDPTSNVATIRTAPSYANFAAYCAEARFDSLDENSEPIIARDAALVSDDEGGSDDDWGIDSGPTLNLHNSGQRRPNAMGGDPDDRTDSHLPNTAIAEPNEPNLIEQDEMASKAQNAEAELLQMHYKFGHASFSKLQTMARNGILPARLSKCRVPVCAACMYGKATKRPWRSKVANNRPEAYKPTRPGEVIAVDQLKSPTPGFIAQLSGNLTSERYNYATVFVDAYSGWGHVCLQKTQSGQETLEAKRSFERLCLKDGVKVHHYHADNGVFRSKLWLDDCHLRGQGITFAGVDAHHQNGKAEVRIRHLQELTRSALLHAVRKWPQEITTHLWPYALRMASESINATPIRKNREGRSPEQLFGRTEVETNPKHWIHFGSPVYVLDPSLRGSSRIFHKWKNRSKVGIYLGRSPQHNRSIALVLNPESGRVSPQFHVKHDSNFDTIAQLYDGSNHSSKWQLKAGLVKAPASNKSSPEDNENRISEMPRPASNSMGPSKTHNLLQAPRADFPQQPLAEPTAPSAPDEADEPSNPLTQSEGATRPPTADDQHGKRKRTRSVPGEPQRASNRDKRPVQRLIEAMTSELGRAITSAFELFSFQALLPSEDDEVVAMKAQADPDSMYLHEARKQPDWSDFADAMQLEIDQQINAGLYTIIKRDEVPEGATVLPAVWQLRRKRDIRSGKVKKHKARCNIDGSRMVHGEHYDQTYAPVAGWTAIRLVLALVLMHVWHAVTLDYVLAYPQAPAVRQLYMEIPKGFTLDGVSDPKRYVLQINRNIYGGKDSGRTWYLYLKGKLEQIGFKQSRFDDCIFYKGKMIYVLYTDDSILAGPSKKEIDSTIAQMRQVLDLTVEDKLTDFLGVNIDRRDDGTIKLSQPKLIQQVINDLHLEQDQATTRTTPAASSRILTRKPDSRAFDNHFNYRSVIGKLHYLVAGSRSEIAYAVHQCARFAHDPKMEHAQAVKWIGRYLKGTMTEGTILRPDKSRPLEVYVDADFAGNWEPDDAATDRSTARSRHGYYILYGGIPIAWKSTLQQEIALSSTESEITGLSYALREAIPIISLLEEMHELGYPVTDTGTKVHCQVFEDNSGALEIAKVHKYRPRTKHLNNRLWHFRTYVDRGVITLHPIRSADQPADILTKPLNEADFTRNRKLINGW